jgi:hypothetical protein
MSPPQDAGAERTTETGRRYLVAMDQFRHLEAVAAEEHLARLCAYYVTCETADFPDDRDESTWALMDLWTTQVQSTIDAAHQRVTDTHRAWVGVSIGHALDHIRGVCECEPIA